MSPEKRKPYSGDYMVIKGQTLSTVSTAIYVGVELYVSSDLTWNKQVERVAAKVNRTLGFIRTVTTSSEAKAVAYNHIITLV